jgi:hypothetical protein
MYIPVCPVTEANAEYMAKQRDSFLAGIPPPDFPGGKGESEHSGRPTVEYLREYIGMDGLRSMGFASMDAAAPGLSVGEQGVLQQANRTLAFS